jgi:hypothetical protein
MSASSALDYEKVLPKLIRKALHLEILWHGWYCIYIQHRIASIFTRFLRAKTGLDSYEWARKGVPVLQLLFTGRAVRISLRSLGTGE